MVKRIWSKLHKMLTHWERETHICVGKLTIIASDNGLSPGQRQAIIWTNAGILLIGPLGTNVSESSIGIQTFSLKKMHLNMSSAKWRPFCLGLNVLTDMYLWSSSWCVLWQFGWGCFNWYRAGVFQINIKRVNNYSEICFGLVEILGIHCHKTMTKIDMNTRYPYLICMRIY